MAKKENKTISINEIDYGIDSLSESVKNNIGSLRIVDQEIANLQQKLAIAQTARNAYAKAVNEELPEQ
jgi:hypothetical protein